MIYDYQTQVSCSAPGDGVSVTYSTAIDLLDGNDGVPPLFGTGERIFMQFEVTTGFTVGAGAPLAQFGCAISSTNPLTSDAHVLGLTGGSIATNIGVDAGQLALGRVFHLPIPAWEDVVEIDGAAWPATKNASTLAAFRALRYMGCVIHQPMPVAASANYFSSGAVTARLIKDPAGTAVASNIFPSRMRVN